MIVPQMWAYSFLMILLLLWPEAAATAGPDVKPGCQEKCGNVSVPYPFGIGDPNCAINDDFFLNCSVIADGQPDQLLFRNTPVRSISVQEGTITVGIFASFVCYDRKGLKTDQFNFTVNLGSLPFMFSDTRNIFTVIGCDVYAWVTDSNFTYGAGCLSLCTEKASMSDANPCVASGCCQTSIPRGLKSLKISPSSFSNNTEVADFNLCRFAVLADKTSLKLSDWPLSRKPAYDKNAYLTDRVDVVVEWAVKNENCEEAKANRSSYGCGSNTYCSHNDGPGYRCFCNEGFEGNPYLQYGCQDINECEDPEKYQCHAKCKNTIGDYECKCSLGMRGDGKTGCQGFGIITIISAAVAAVLGVLILVIGGWWLHKITKKRRSIKLREKFFKQNGGLLLQQHLSSSDQDTVLKAKLFSSKELETATDGFNANRILGQGGQGTVYKGMLADGGIVAVKRSKMVDEKNLEGFINEVFILSQISHRNVVRLLGCCLETEVPLLVYEFIPNGTLFQYLHGKKSEEFSLSWEMRLQIAAETAGALFYLHSAAAIPIYHRDIKSTNILLDDKYRAKVADFGTSRSLAKDQTHLTTNVQGTFGYLDPEYFRSSQFTEKSDVYSLGVVLVELLSGKKAIFTNQSQESQSLAEHFVLLMEENRVFDIIDAQVKERCPQEDVMAVANLANRCLKLNGKKRPTMKEITLELERIIGSSRKMANIQQIHKEAESIVVEGTSMWSDASTSITCSSFQVDGPDVEPLVPFKTWRFN